MLAENRSRNRVKSSERNSLLQGAERKLLPTGDTQEAGTGAYPRNRESGRPDLNRGPLAPEASALPGCATSRLVSGRGLYSEGGWRVKGCFWGVEGFRGLRGFAGSVC